VAETSQTIGRTLPDRNLDQLRVPEVVLACAICGAPLRGEPELRLGESHLRACNACGSWTYLPRRSSSDQAAVHDTEEYFDHPYFALRRGVSPALIRRCRDIFARLEPETDIDALRGHRLLDVGCDTGGFLQAAAQEFGIVPVGVDAASRAVEAARQHGIEAYLTTIESAPEHLRDFRLITVIDLIEHVIDPGSFLRQVSERLRPGGLVYLETPNIQSAVYRIGRTLGRLPVWQPTEMLERLFPPQHVQYFTLASLEGLARAVGFEVVRIQTRVLPWSDIAASFPVRAATSAMQLLDRWTATRILIWAVLRRPT
jgi:2-polyprenyl-3-methyl-5-hydroxy-6-metoxy-1,4-benzoquinol methylase